MKKIFRKIKKGAFRLKLWLLDWEFYTFNPLSRGLVYPPSFYLLHTPEEQQKIRERDQDKFKEHLQKIMEEAKKNASGPP